MIKLISKFLSHSWHRIIQEKIVQVIDGLGVNLLGAYFASRRRIKFSFLPLSLRWRKIVKESKAKESKMLPEGDNRAHSRMAAGKQEGQISGGRAVLCPMDYRSRSSGFDSLC